MPRERAIEIGERLIAARGMVEQKDIAERAGISQTALSNYEHGNRIPNDDAKARLAKALGKSIIDLFF